MEFSEQAILPYSALHCLVPGPALIFAPHPDDEVFGCGGAIMRHAQAGDAIRVIVVTDGAFGAETETYASARQQESIRAAEILGYGTPEFWDFPDRGLEYGERLIQRLSTQIDEFGAELVYAPSWWEAHPDHRALAMAAAEAVRRSPRPIRLAMYEIGVPLQPNTLLDITDLIERKAAAVACFRSQLERQDYDRQIAALNRFRTYTLPRSVEAAEGYVILSTEELQQIALGETRRRDLPGLPSEASIGTENPLVSVIIRSTDRALLNDALDSIAAQTYPHIEAVVVNAKGEGHSLLSPWCGRFPLRFVPSDEPLHRSRAANAGLEQAQGEYLIFLDDDDIFYPDHVAALVDTLSRQEQALCAYSGVRVEFYSEGKVAHATVFSDSFEPEKLRGRNFIPIHAALFHRSLIEKGCRFDERLDRLEDWDFWLQVSEHTRFIHIDRISACYRNHGDSGFGKELEADMLRKTTGAVFDKWKTRWSGEQWAEIILLRDNLCAAREQQASDLQNRLTHTQNDLAHYADELEQAQQAFNALHVELEQARNRLAERDTDLAQQGADLEERTSQLEQTRFHLTTLEEEIARQQAWADIRESELTQLKRTIEHLNTTQWHTTQEMHALSAWASRLQLNLDSVLNSTSWRATGPLRLGTRLLRGEYRDAWDSLRRQTRPLGRALYNTMPRRWATPLVHTMYYRFGPLFAGFDDYERWLRGPEPIDMPIEVTPAASEPPDSGMVDIHLVPPLEETPSGRIAVHAHLYYSDLAPEIAAHLEQIPFPFDLFVSVASDADSIVCRRAFAHLPRVGLLTISVVPNRGRDIAPMFCTFGRALANYDFIAHIHGKKSLYNNGATAGWREHLLTNLLGTENQVRKIFTLLTGAGCELTGLVYPQNFHGLPYVANTWLSNRTMGQAWCARLGIEFPSGYFSFPAGSMFWARTDALRPLFDAGLTLDDFPEEAGQTDGTLAHCLERLLALVPEQSGLATAILRDPVAPSWSPWRIDQYLDQAETRLRSAIDAPEVRIVAFDIFDTLLVRPLLNPESIKAIIAKRAGGEIGEAYLRFRAQAETQAREKAGRDIGLDAIFDELASISGMPGQAVSDLRRLEEIVEHDAVSPRQEAVASLHYALEQGKRVVLASDMFLPRATVESMLRANGINIWHALYLSSDTGLRKDSGDTYRHILEQELAAPDSVLMIGDSEHSDLQIPMDLGFRCAHVLRPVDLARSRPQLNALIESTLDRSDLHAELTLGIIVRDNFAPLSFPHFDPEAFALPSAYSIGYSILGPLVLSFVQWLAKKATEDHIERLYFLSREGQFLKTVYDHWTSHQPSATASSRYLVLSRRAITVPAIHCRADIEKIAKKPHFPNTAESFLFERFGLEPDAGLIKKLKKHWPKDKPVTVQDGDITQIRPLLRALEKSIYAQSRRERPGLLRYLEQMGLNQPVKSAVVDIGYSATIQEHLNRLLGREIHGYYMATDTGAAKVSASHGVSALGCFVHCAEPTPEAHAIYRLSFHLEKLLSADDGQIVRYRLENNGEAIPEYRTPSETERGTRTVRADIRRGALDFVDAAIATRNVLLDDFEIPADLVKEAYKNFAENPSASELEILRSLVLDDHYCGRGLVS